MGLLDDLEKAATIADNLKEQVEDVVDFFSGKSKSSSLAKDKKTRAFAAARFYLELDGQKVGVITSVDGGNFKSEPIGEQVGGEGLVTRYPGRQKFEDITLQVGASMAPGFWKWIKASIGASPERRAGAIVTCDFDGYERSRRTFSEALISEVQFPGCDAKAKAPALVTVKIAVERLDYERQDAELAPMEAPITKQKMWLPRNYQLTLEKLDKETTKHVVKIDPISVKQQIIQNPVGREKWPRIEAGRVEFPTLSIHVPETYLKPWYEWWKKFVGEVEHDAQNETTGSIVYLASDCKTPLMTLGLSGVGISTITFEKHETTSEALRIAKIDLYTESVDFKEGKGTEG